MAWLKRHSLKIAYAPSDFLLQEAANDNFAGRGKCEVQPFPFTFWTSGGGATTYVNSVQQVSITIAAGATSGTATISAVGAKAFIISGNQTASSSTVASHNFARIELTNTTTVTAFRNTSDASLTITVVASVIDATSSLVKSVQSGTISFASGVTSNTATISSVSTTNAVVVFLGSINNGAATNPTANLYNVALTSATVITATRNSTGLTGTVGFIVIEFQAAALNSSVQQISATFINNVTSNTSTITSVNTANSMVFFGGILTGGATLPLASYNVQLTNGTTLTYNRGSSSTATRTINNTVVEFISGVINSIQRGTITINSVTSNTATISSVNTSKSLCNFLGFSTSATTMDEAFADLVLTNSTTVTGSKDLAGTSTSTPSYEIAQFN